MSAVVPDIAKAEIAIVELTNAYRKQNALAEVKPNPELAKAARIYAEFLAKTTIFSHTADGRQPSDRTQAAGYQHCQVAENLSLNVDSRGFQTQQIAEAAVNGWISSPGHRRNLLGPYVIDIGVGIAKVTGQDKYLSVQIFGRPQTLAYQFKVNNLSPDLVVYTHGEETHEIKPRFSVSHTVCQPAPVFFERAGSGPKARTIHARYDTANGDTFILRGVAGGGITVEVEKTLSSGISQQPTAR